MDKCINSRPDNGSGGRGFIEHRRWKRCKDAAKHSLIHNGVRLGVLSGTPDERIDIKSVVIKLNKTKLALVHDRNHSAFPSDRGNTSRTWT
ncbi:hypothetical protein M0R45_019107 [Rubus argutus]|uniref:Uncharacterized protein n=1 Tax=Rubus argutus TaxID=59490 RepID=A0AAW1X4Y5_RUBAR